MAELADALDSGSSGGNFVEVQVLLPAPKERVPWVLSLFSVRRVLEGRAPAAGGAVIRFFLIETPPTLPCVPRAV